MPDGFCEFMLRQRPTAERPLAGQTVLVVDDSRYASEALRLLCVRSGARVRRADSLASAARHLASYRPSVMVVDLGLPDGSGAELIAGLRARDPDPPAVLAVSGDPAGQAAALAAGACAFLPKPVESVALFQETVLACLPEEARPRGPRALTDEAVQPDRLALQDDLAQAARAMKAPETRDRLPYLAQFLSSVAHCARDRPLEEAARALTEIGSRREALRRASALLERRLARRAVI